MKFVLRAWGVVIGCLLLLALLAACAPGSSNTASSPVSPTQTATAAASGAAGLNGCPAANPPANAGTKADVVVTFKSGAQGPTVTLNKGQTLEVRLQPTMHWSLNIQGDASVLTASSGNGWYDASLDSCVWRFTAANQGNTTLAFTGVAVCKPNTECPALAAAQEYDVTVK
jgi:hypothetical protein